MSVSVVIEWSVAEGLETELETALTAVRDHITDEHPEIQARGPQHYGGSPVSILLYVDDVDALFKQAIAAGGTETRPVEDQFYGDRSGSLTDPFGHCWHLSTHTEDVSMEELNRRMAALAKK